MPSLYNSENGSSDKPAGGDTWWLYGMKGEGGEKGLVLIEWWRKKLEKKEVGSTLIFKKKRINVILKSFTRSNPSVTHKFCDINIRGLRDAFLLSKKYLFGH